MLNLRGGVSVDQNSRWTQHPTKAAYLPFSDSSTTTKEGDFIDTVIGNLGDPVSYWEEDSQERESGETSASRSQSTGQGQEREGGIELTLLQHGRDSYGRPGPDV